MNITDVLQAQVGDQVIFSENNFYSVLHDVYTVMDVKKLSNGHKIALIVNNYFRGWFNCNRLIVVIRYQNYNIHNVKSLYDLENEEISDTYNSDTYNIEIDMKKDLVRNLDGSIRRI